MTSSVFNSATSTTAAPSDNNSNPSGTLPSRGTWSSVSIEPEADKTGRIYLVLAYASVLDIHEGPIEGTAASWRPLKSRCRKESPKVIVEFKSVSQLIANNQE